MRKSRYSLRFLFAVVTIVAALLAFTQMHGLFGIVLLAPHVGIFVLTKTLWLRRRVAAHAVLIVYLASWLATYQFGTSQIRNHVLSGAKHSDGMKILDYDPVLDRSPTHEEPPPPWLFVGNRSTPCPFVVSIEYGSQLAHLLGSGHHTYVFWIFGYEHAFHDRVTWNS